MEGCRPGVFLDRSHRRNPGSGHLYGRACGRCCSARVCASPGQARRRHNQPRSHGPPCRSSDRARARRPATGRRGRCAPRHGLLSALPQITRLAARDALLVTPEQAAARHRAAAGARCRLGSSRGRCRGRKATPRFDCRTCSRTRGRLPSWRLILCRSTASRRSTCGRRMPSRRLTKPLPRMPP